MPKANPSPSESRYKHGRKCTTLVLDADLVEFAKAYLPTTRHVNVSRFVENAIRTLARKDAPRIRKNGHKLPRSLHIGARTAAE